MAKKGKGKIRDRRKGEEWQTRKGKCEGKKTKATGKEKDEMGRADSEEKRRKGGDRGRRKAENGLACRWVDMEEKKGIKQCLPNAKPTTPSARSRFLD